MYILKSLNVIRCVVANFMMSSNREGEKVFYCKCQRRKSWWSVNTTQQRQHTSISLLIWSPQTFEYTGEPMYMKLLNHQGILTRNSMHAPGGLKIKGISAQHQFQSEKVGMAWPGFFVYQEPLSVKDESRTERFLMDGISNRKILYG